MLYVLESMRSNANSFFFIVWQGLAVVDDKVPRNWQRIWQILFYSRLRLQEITALLNGEMTLKR